MIGTAADLWGDVPSSEAVDQVNHPTPKYDNQLAIYAALQTVLDDAIKALKGSTGAGPAFNGVDLVYGGDKALWQELAHTLKARYYLHVAEGDNTAYAKALTEAQLGISKPANDYRTYQSSLTPENNFWYQFQIIQRDSYLRMGKRLVDLMLARNDPRVPLYFSPLVTALWTGNHVYAVGV